uniref:Uncharacterized protein n=1 Tax=Opuntia streptacantha TaxID=393608 RepID=A0A7C9EQF0_OPUST
MCLKNDCVDLVFGLMNYNAVAIVIAVVCGLKLDYLCYWVALIITRQMQSVQWFTILEKSRFLIMFVPIDSVKTVVIHWLCKQWHGVKKVGLETLSKCVL